MEIKFEIKNYKKIRSLLAEFESGNVYYISGKNGTAKTSFLQALVFLVSAL